MSNSIDNLESAWGRFVFALEDDREPVAAVDVSTAIFDLVLVHEIAAVVSLEEYADYDFKNFFIAGRYRPISRDHQLRVDGIRLASPLDLITYLPHAVGAAGGLYAFYKLVEFVYTVDIRLRVARKTWRAREAELDDRLQRAEVRRAAERLQKRQGRQRMRLRRGEIGSGQTPALDRPNRPESDSAPSTE